MKTIHSFSRMSIRRQLKIIVSIVLFLFAVMCGLISLLTCRMIYENEDEHMQTRALRIWDQIELTYEKMENFCINIGEDQAVQNLLTSDYSEMSRTRGEATECLTRYRVLEPMIVDISLVNDRIHYSNVYRTEELDEIRRQTDGTPFGWLGIRSYGYTADAGKTDLMVYAGEITVEKEKIGTIILSVDPMQIYSGDETEENQMYFLADRESVLFDAWTPAEELPTVYQLWEELGYKEIIETRRYILRSYDFGNMGCSLVSVLDKKSTGIQMNQIPLLIWECVLHILIFCVILFRMLSKGVVRPLHQFHESIEGVRKSGRKKLDTSLDLQGCQEIRELGKEFSAMMGDIETLNRTIFQSATDLYELKIGKQEAEMAYLRSQIDPHFLYNTLEVIRQKALEKDAPEISQMVMDMGSIFRYSAKGEDVVAFGEELAIIQSYIRIQQMRFQGKIEVYYFVPEDVLELKVMKMVLQPFVENAIFHGLEPKSGTGSLFIGARLEENMLVITVKDDGVGISEELLEELRQELQDENADTRKHIGTLNTNARIRLLYGKEYGISIESCIGDGTTVTIRIPAENRKERGE